MVLLVSSLLWKERNSHVFNASGTSAHFLATTVFAEAHV
jgi:hypothetical protein